MRYYVYKIFFKNGATYVGLHREKKPNDGYITSSIYYKKHKDLFDHRDILIECPDNETCEIMETICILADYAANPMNVNGNKGAWTDSSLFDRGFSGELNGMYGKHLKDFMSEDEYKAWRESHKKSLAAYFEKKYGEFKRTHNGMTPCEWKKYKTKRYNEKLREINAKIRNAHKKHKEYLRSLPHFWQYNPETLEETYLGYLKEGWVKGRVPHELWTEERKKSYAEKHSINPFENKDEVFMERYRQESAERQKGKICFTDGKTNRYLRQGEDIPEGFYRGCTFTKSDLYWGTRKKKWQK